jgi:galactose mutarotase-like enzyme
MRSKVPQGTPLHSQSLRRFWQHFFAERTRDRCITCILCQQFFARLATKQKYRVDRLLTDFM